MRYLGFDLGTRTLGISISDETKTIATGLTTLRFADSDYDSLLDDIKKIIKDYNVEKIVLGLPKNMNNTIGERAETTLKFKDKLEEELNIEVVMQDALNGVLTWIDELTVCRKVLLTHEKTDLKFGSYFDGFIEYLNKLIQPLKLNLWDECCSLLCNLPEFVSKFAPSKKI